MIVKCPFHKYTLCFEVTVENKVHIVSTVWLLQWNYICLSYTRQSKFTKTSYVKKFQTGGRAPGAPVRVLLVLLFFYATMMAKSRIKVANIYLLLMRIKFKACLYICSKYRNSLYKVHKYVLHVHNYYTSVKRFPIWRSGDYVAIYTVPK